MNTSEYYLDHAAATPLDPAVYSAMQPFLQTEFANPSSLYRSARRTRQALDTARHTVANILGAKITEIIFSSGGTESNNLAIRGVLDAHTDASWVTTNIEHDAVLAQVDPLGRAGHPATIVPVKPNGIVDPSAIIAAIDDRTVLVSVMLANNEIGTIQPVAEIARQLRAIRADRSERGIELPIYFHTDAVQAPNFLDLHVDRLGVDLLSLSGSKIYGPRGTGALYIRHTTVLHALHFGGGQERGLRSGTENVPGIVGFALSLELAATNRNKESHRIGQLRDDLEKRLLEAIPAVILNGDPKRRLPNNLNLTIPSADGESMVLYLDKVGIMASTGSACSSDSLDPSHVLLAIGRSGKEARQSLRLTLGRSTEAETCDLLVAQLPAIVRRLHQISSV